MSSNNDTVCLRRSTVRCLQNVICNNIKNNAKNNVKVQRRRQSKSVSRRSRSSFTQKEVSSQIISKNVRRAAFILANARIRDYYAKNTKGMPNSRRSTPLTIAGERWRRRSQAQRSRSHSYAPSFSAVDKYPIRRSTPLQRRMTPLNNTRNESIGRSQRSQSARRTPAPAYTASSCNIGEICRKLEVSGIVTPYVFFC